MSPSRSALARAFANPYVLLVLTPFLWACNWVVGRGLSADIPPMAMSFLRWLFAALLLVPVAVPRLAESWPKLRGHWPVLWFLGAVGVGLHTALAYAGLGYTTATNGVILNSFIPVLIIVMTALFLRERVGTRQVAGVLVSFVGVLAILAEGRPASLLALDVNVGDGLILVSMAMWAAYTVALRWQPEGLDPLVFLFVLACLGAATLLPCWIAELALGRRMAVTLVNVGALLSVALFSSVLAFVFWNRGVRDAGAVVAGVFVHLMPVFGALMAWLFLGEHLAGYHVVGIGLILTGVFIASRVARPGMSTAVGDR